MFSTQWLKHVVKASACQWLLLLLLKLSDPATQLGYLPAQQLQLQVPLHQLTGGLLLLPPEPLLLPPKLL